MPMLTLGPLSDEWLGDYRMGDVLDLALPCVTAAFVAANPSASPLFSIYNGAGTKVASGVMPRKDQRTTGWFQWAYPLTLSLTAGVYTAVLSYVVSSQTRYKIGRFRVAAGGDADGNIIGAVEHGRPEVSHLVYETQSGKIVEGRNPQVAVNP